MITYKKNNNEDWAMAEIAVNGVDMRIVTNGRIVRVMSLDHIYAEIQLISDKNYGDGNNYFEKIEEFIHEKDMEIS